MKKAVPETVFFASWLTAGSAIDRIFDDWRACVIFVFAFIFLIAAAIVLAGGEEEKDGMDHSRDHRNCIRSVKCGKAIKSIQESTDGVVQSAERVIASADEMTNAFRELVQEVNDGEQQSDSTVEEDAGA